MQICCHTMVTHVTRLSQRSAYGPGVIFGLALLAALARLVEGELAAVAALLSARVDRWTKQGVLAGSVVGVVLVLVYVLHRLTFDRPRARRAWWRCGSRHPAPHMSPGNVAPPPGAPDLRPGVSLPGLELLRCLLPS
jgi:hypothetical protein